MHVPLPEVLQRRLRAETKRTKRPATELARNAIDRWLSEVRREALHKEIAAYARKNAGTPADLDPELEAAAVDPLREERARDY